MSSYTVLAEGSWPVAPAADPQVGEMYALEREGRAVAFVLAHAADSSLRSLASSLMGQGFSEDEAWLRSRYTLRYLGAETACRIAALGRVDESAGQTPQLVPVPLDSLQARQLAVSSGLPRYEAGQRVASVIVDAETAEADVGEDGGQQQEERVPGRGQPRARASRRGAKRRR